ncbi:MAG: HAMP domain-containing histidine kinase [Chitinophagaceae bacterium]|nr:HAMP domain-containing histidine kinase [Chitinophagaceae bacterium]MCW5905127.1 HAMP domain-containing histidine kinase [Chitinophagaceae bacterium]
MNIQRRFAFYFSLIFSLLLAVVMVLVYSLFADFRQDEFEQRLKEKAATTLNLLVEIKKTDYQLLKLIDRNTINELYNEKTLVFNDSMELIYSSLDDAPLYWTKEELVEIKHKKTIFKKSDKYDVYSLFYDTDDKDYFIIISAEDKYGIRKLEYLKYVLLFSFLLGSSTVWFFSFRLSKKTFAPLTDFKNQIFAINDANLNNRIQIKNDKNEIGSLAHSFNDMLDRIQIAYNRQKNFTANASHEIRTPITRIVTQIENLIQNQTNEQHTKNLKSIADDAYLMSDIVASLLLLSKMDSKEQLTELKKIRIDELVFNCVDIVQQQYADMKFNFDIQSTDDDVSLDINGDETLLRVAFINLIKNAYLYSDNKTVSCTLKPNQHHIQVAFSNTGLTPNEQELKNVFTPFIRGSNTQNKQGSGLGLSIVYRIITYHHAEINYTVPEQGINTITITFPLHN